MSLSQHAQLALMCVSVAAATWIVSLDFVLGLAAWIAIYYGSLLTLRAVLDRIPRSAKTLQLPVVITGCDSGFGLMTAQHLTRRGIPVVAGCLTSAGVAQLVDQAKKENLKLHAFMLDVTSDTSVSAFAASVAAVAPGGVATLINNAGVMLSGVLDMAPVRQLQTMLDINTIGSFRVAKAFVPLLRQARGRVVCIASICGRVSAAGVGPYCASKFAVEALADSWRLELGMWGIDVVIVEPGAMDTTLFVGRLDERAADELWAGASAEVQALYGRDWLTQNNNKTNRVLKRMLNPPSMVVDALTVAATARFPQARYHVGKDARLAIPLSFLPSPLQDFLAGVVQRLPTPAALLANKKKS